MGSITIARPELGNREVDSRDVERILASDENLMVKKEFIELYLFILKRASVAPRGGERLRGSDLEQGINERL